MCFPNSSVSLKVSKFITAAKASQCLVSSRQRQVFHQTEYEIEPSLKDSTASAVLATNDLCSTLFALGTLCQSILCKFSLAF